MSCQTLTTPSRFWASEMFSRRAHSAARLGRWRRGAVGHAALRHRPRRQPRFRRPQGRVDAGVAGRSTAHTRDRHRPAGRGTGDVLEDQIQGLPADELEGGDTITDTARRRPSSSTAAAGSPTASQAVADARRRAKSLRLVAVTMPSVPSRTDEKLLEVVARVVLAQCAQAVPDLPVGEHHLQAEHRVRGRCRSAAPARHRRWWR